VEATKWKQSGKVQKGYHDLSGLRSCGERGGRMTKGQGAGGRKAEKLKVESRNQKVESGKLKWESGK
jgi:hypothetical protein